MARSTVYLLMVLSSAFGSGAFVAGKLAVAQFPPCTLTFFRFLVALPFIFLILARSGSQPLVPRRSQWGPLIGMGLVGPFLYHILFFSSLRHTTAINDSLIGSSLPTVTLILSVILLGERVTWLSGGGVLLAFSGVALVVSNGSLEVVRQLQFNPGDGLMLAAVLCWAIYMVLSRRFMASHHISPVAWTAYTFLVCTVAIFPFVLWERPATFLPSVTLQGWLSVIYMGIFSSALAYWFQQIGIQEIGPSITALFTNLVPVFTIVLASYILHEPITPLKLTSAGLIVVGVYLGSRQEVPK